MQTRIRIAIGSLALGVIGLFSSQFPTSPVGATLEMRPQTVSVAITSGPQLRLIRTTETGAHKSATASRQMHCASVYRLTVADVGFQCRDLGTPGTLAAISL